MAEGKRKDIDCMQDIVFCRVISMNCTAHLLRKQLKKGSLCRKVCSFCKICQCPQVEQYLYVRTITVKITVKYSKRGEISRFCTFHTASDFRYKIQLQYKNPKRAVKVKIFNMPHYIVQSMSTYSIIVSHRTKAYNAGNKVNS